MNGASNQPAIVDIDAQRTWGSRLVAASASEIFALIANPHRHWEFDGSKTVRKGIEGPTELTRGDSFSMAMSFPLPVKALPYRVSSKVVEYEHNVVIAWAHFGKHRWRYELESVVGATLVTETFDWSTSLFPPAIVAVGYPDRHRSNIDATLERLARLFEREAPR